MFVEHKEALEVTEAPAKTLRLSEAIREGSKHLEESVYDYLNGNGCGCAVAMAGVGYGLPDKWTSNEHLFAHVSRSSGLPLSFLVNEVEDRHIRTADKTDQRGMNALQIADWLESQGL